MGMAEMMYETFEDRKARYIKSDPYFCLYCEQRTVWGGHIESEEEFGIREVVCHSCKKRWKEVYHLAGIEEME